MSLPCNSYLFSFVVFSHFGPSQWALSMCVHVCRTQILTNTCKLSQLSPVQSTAQSTSLPASVWAFARVRMWTEFLNRTRKLDIENYVYALYAHGSISAPCLVPCLHCTQHYIQHSQLLRFSRGLGRLPRCGRCSGIRRRKVGHTYIDRYSHNISGRKVTVLSCRNYKARRRKW